MIDLNKNNTPDQSGNISEAELMQAYEESLVQENQSLDELERNMAQEELEPSLIAEWGRGEGLAEYIAEDERYAVESEHSAGSGLFELLITLLFLALAIIGFLA